MIAVVDYSCGNTHAFINAFKYLNVDSVVASTIDEIENADKIILPGVGSFDYVMNNFNRSGLREIVEKKVLLDKIPILGICAGMQIFAEKSEEGKEKGLEWINGEIKVFNIEKINYRTKLPHMGWNIINPISDSLFYGLNNQSRFYFVHSYYFHNFSSENCISTTHYAGFFTSAVKKNNIYGVQFHPEKSHDAGLQLLKNFSEL